MMARINLNLAFANIKDRTQLCGKSLQAAKWQVLNCMFEGYYPRYVEHGARQISSDLFPNSMLFGLAVASLSTHHSIEDKPQIMPS